MTALVERLNDWMVTPEPDRQSRRRRRNLAFESANNDGDDGAREPMPNGARWT
jgi:hypothetical protein